MDTLPRFRFPDESSSQNVNKARSPSWSDFDDLDALETRVKPRAQHAQSAADFSAEFAAMPTQVRPQLGRAVREPLRVVKAKDANVDDVVEELRAAAAGRSSRVRELNSADLLDEVPDADEAQEVDVSELVFDRVVARRQVWNVRQAARPTQVTILGPKISKRFLLTAAVAMLFGALLPIAAALVVWRLGGFSL